MWRVGCQPHQAGLLVWAHQWRRSFLYPRFLKYCTSRSRCLAFSSVEKVPRLRRFPVDASFLREYNRNSPDLSLRIMPHRMLKAALVCTPRFCTKTTYIVATTSNDVGEPRAKGRQPEKRQRR